MVSLLILAGAGMGCLGSTDDAATGVLGVDLTGTAPSGAVYRLRDASIVVDGPTPTVFNTEDDPTRTSLSANVDAGDYAATVEPGWRMERLAGGEAVPVSATLISDNPASFSVVAQQRTSVPLRFHIDGEGASGYDITLDIDDSAPWPGGAYQEIDAPSPRRRVVFDMARQAIYAANTLDQEIQRFTFDNGLWAATGSVGIPRLTDIAIAPDGQTLIVLDEAHVSDISLAGGAFTPTQRATISDSYCSPFFDKVAVGSNNKAIVVTSYRQYCGYSSTSYVYDTASHELSSLNSLYTSTVAASADGTRIYAGGSYGVQIYIPQSGSISSPITGASVSAMSISGDASRVILQSSLVYSRSLTLLGNLAPSGVALASRDASRAYVYRDDAPGPRLDVYDLNGPLQAGALFPVARTIRLPHSPNAANSAGAIAMTSNADDSLVFISGDRRILIVPVN
jgi:hypothetical protein